MKTILTLIAVLILSGCWANPYAYRGYGYQPYVYQVPQDNFGQQYRYVGPGGQTTFYRGLGGGNYLVQGAGGNGFIRGF